MKYLPILILFLAGCLYAPNNLMKDDLLTHSSAVQEWENNNPKANNCQIAPTKPADDAIWNNGIWIIPTPNIPDTITARQIRIWFIQNGYSLSQIDSILDSISDNALRDISKIRMGIRHTHRKISSDGGASWKCSGLSSSQIDQAFIEASNI